MIKLKLNMLFLVIAVFMSISVFSQKLDKKLIKSAQKGLTMDVRTLLQNGASIDAIDKKGKTALIYSSEQGHMDVVKTLLDRNASITIVDELGETALDKAIRYNYTEIAILLEYTQANNICTIEAYDSFMKKYPNNKYSDQVQNKILDIEFSRVQENNTIEAYDSFMKKYPNNKYSDQIQNKILDIKFSKVQEENTLEGYVSFFGKYLNARYLDKIQDTDLKEKVLCKIKINSLDYNNYNKTLLDLSNIMKDHKELLRGDYRINMREVLDSLCKNLPANYNETIADKIAFIEDTTFFALPEDYYEWAVIAEMRFYMAVMAMREAYDKWVGSGASNMFKTMNQMREGMSELAQVRNTNIMYVVKSLSRVDDVESRRRMWQAILNMIQILNEDEIRIYKSENDKYFYNAIRVAVNTESIQKNKAIGKQIIKLIL